MTAYPAALAAKEKTIPAIVFRQPAVALRNDAFPLAACGWEPQNASPAFFEPGASHLAFSRAQLQPAYGVNGFAYGKSRPVQLFPQSLNLYSYVLNNPVSNSDPDGHLCLLGHNFLGSFGGSCSSKPSKPPVKEGGDDTTFDQFLASAHAEADKLAHQAWSNFTGASCRAQVCQSSVLPEGELIEEGLGELAPKLTQFGWEGSASWRAAVSEIKAGGTIEEIAGKVPTRSEAESLLEKAGAVDTRPEEGHFDGVNPHSYDHINFRLSNGTRGTIRIQGLGGN